MWERNSKADSCRERPFSFCYGILNYFQLAARETNSVEHHLEQFGNRLPTIYRLKTDFKNGVVHDWIARSFMLNQECTRFAGF